MPRSVDEILAHADELAARFESDEFDGDRVSPAEYELIAAVRARGVVEARIVHAVEEARSVGLTWAKVGELIGTSGEAARQRYSHA